MRKRLQGLGNEQMALPVEFDHCVHVWSYLPEGGGR